MTLFTCKKCLTPQPKEQFNAHKLCANGIWLRCKTCLREKRKALYAMEKEQAKALSTKWRKENPAKKNANNAYHRAAKRHRTPKWLNEQHFQQIEMFYEAAQKLTAEFGVQMDVDHIVPLQGKNVSGLHVPWNLQVLSESENCSKRNLVNL